MSIIVSAVFGLLGLYMLLNGFQSFRARKVLSGIALDDMRDQARKSLDRSGLIACVVGCSFVLASISAWWNLPVALVLGCWPVLVFALMASSGKVTVISRLSAGSTDEEG